jgi:atypical dual specificity phosphatase
MVRLPWSASWIVDGKVLAGPYPRTAGALASLAKAGIGLCVNLHERPLPADRLSALGLSELHLPVRDFTAPPPETLVTAVSAMDEALAIGKPVSVNCGWGFGRTGTVVACWLVGQGMSPGRAIALVRERRPKSIETTEQERAIHSFAASLSGGQP